MKCDVSTKVYHAWGVSVDQANVNKYVKAVVVNFGDERGDIIVENDNFGTRRKYAVAYEWTMEWLQQPPKGE